MVLLRQEVVAALDHGPRRRLANVFKDARVKVVLWDATPLVRELLPELSLHFSRVRLKDGSQFDNLEYVLVRDTNEVLDPTETALSNWLMDNAGVQRETQLDTAIKSIRSLVINLSPDGQKRAYRHLRLLNQELMTS